MREPGVIRFRHPLLRSAAWADATPAERRAAQAALARTVTASRARLWHRADPATTPDVELAAALEASPQDDRRRLDEARRRALAALGVLEHSSGSVLQATRWLREAVDPTNGRRRIEVLAELALVCQRLGDYDGLTNAAVALAAVVDPTDPHQCQQ